MKTISDINALAPRLIALMLDNPEIGERFQDGSGYDETTADNYVSYDDDGWCVEYHINVAVFGIMTAAIGQLRRVGRFNAHGVRSRI